MHYLRTGNNGCFHENGRETECAGSGQDAELLPGEPWPEPRFEVRGAEALDRATGLFWSLDANLFDFPLTHPEALEAVAGLNRREFGGHGDWRLPNRREMRSLISHGALKPALPAGHPFEKVYLGWYWSSTTSAMAPAYAWYVHLEGGRMFYGAKDGYCLSWPVRGASDVLPATGQILCYAPDGSVVECAGSGQDGERRFGVAWPEPRFERVGKTEWRDALTGLVWHGSADLAGGQVAWRQGIELAAGLAESDGKPWRLPTINELESLADASRHSPALPEPHPFSAPGEAYWSSTTSYFEPDWSYCFYLHKGAVGVGFKPNRDFLVWPVYGPV